MKSKVLLVVLILTTLCLAGSAMAMTEQQRQTLIAQIQAQIVLLTQQLTQMIAQQQSGGVWCYTFNNSLGYTGSSTSEIYNLHLALQKEGISYSPDSSYAYSVGTLQGVIKFQIKYGISPTGYVGPVTRAKLNQLYGCVAGSSNPGSGGETCIAHCLTQSDGVYAIDCGGNPTKCSPDQTCNKTYDAAYTYNNDSVQTIQTLNGTQCITTCVPNWQCSNFSACLNSQQTRTCSDTNNCGTTTNRPELTQLCTSCVANCLTQADGVYAIDCSGNPTKCNPTQNCQRTYSSEVTYTSGSAQTVQTLSGTQCVDKCIPNWQCSGFGACTNNQQTQTCTDTDYCNTTEGRPELVKLCTTCAATCVGGFAIDCSGGITKCEEGTVCQKDYSTTYTYNNGAIQTITTLVGSSCAAPPVP